ncbi:UNVERIFIED_CONTAM: fructose-1-phosphate kinase PfkB-like protein [Brevibacillus sp. OAP136]
MIVTVTLNAAIDKTYVLSSFTTGALHRPQQVLSLAGGKGINVARVARTLGIEVTATGFYCWLQRQNDCGGVRQASDHPLLLRNCR